MTGATMVEHHLNAEGADQFILAGVGDANFRELESLFGVKVVLRGESVRLAGELESVTDSARVVEHMIELARLGETVSCHRRGPLRRQPRVTRRAGHPQRRRTAADHGAGITPDHHPRAPRASGATCGPWRSPTS